MAVISEGCADSIRAAIDNILPAILNCVYDQDSVVRECACFAIGI
jgi:hypothetical protein